MKRKKRKSDIMDLVTLAGSEAVRQVDELGFSFLAEHGYDVTGWDGDEETAAATQKRLALELQARGESLAHHGGVDDSSPRFVVWYTLRRAGRVIATSRVVLFKQKPQGGGGEVT